MSAARAIARAEQAGLRLRLRPDGRVVVQASAAPLPPDVLEDLRRHREDVAHLLALRAAVAPPPPPAPAKPAEAAAPPQPAETPSWLNGIARAVRGAVKDGAIRVADEADWLVLARPDGRRTVVAPHIAAKLAQAGLLPDLPPAAVEESVGDASDAVAERGAIQSEPRLPPPGTPARAALDQRQAETVRGLLVAAAQRPPCFEGEASRPPPRGSYCSACRGRRWWVPRRPSADGTRPSAHWRCATCRPADHLPPGERVEAGT
jgi:hypothetical protein